MGEMATGPALGMLKGFGKTGLPTLGGRHFGLAFILPLIAMLTKELEMLQPDAFCEHTIQQNATAARAPPRTPLGSLQCSPDP